MKSRQLHLPFFALMLPFCILFMAEPGETSDPDHMLLLSTFSSFQPSQSYLHIIYVLHTQSTALAHEYLPY